MPLKLRALQELPADFANYRKVVSNEHLSFNGACSAKLGVCKWSANVAVFAGFKGFDRVHGAKCRLCDRRGTSLASRSRRAVLSTVTDGIRLNWKGARVRALHPAKFASPISALSCFGVRARGKPLNPN